jgi:ABC-type Fe3+ transport system permease subunit
VLAAPGLLGPLLLSLLLVAAAQHAGPIGRSAFPLMLALVLQLLPLALLLRALLYLGTDRTALHIARGAGARPADWALSGGPAAGAVLLLFGVAYSDFTTSALLAPPQFTTVFVRIFNLMHYGQGAVLSAAVFIAVATPLLCLGLTRFVLRLYVARRVR